MASVNSVTWILLWLTVPILIHFHYIEKTSQYIVQKVKFCVPLKKESRKGLDEQQGE